MAAIDPAGEHVWWFADTDGDEHGCWMRENFEGAPPMGPEAATLGLPHGYHRGLALGATGAAIALGSRAGTTAWWCAENTTPRMIYQHPGDAAVQAMSFDDSLVVLQHSKHGDALNPGLCAVRVSDGRRVAERCDPGTQLVACGFPPIPGDRRLLVIHERRDRAQLMIWDLDADEEQPLDVPLEGDLRGWWYPDGAALVVAASVDGRTSLHHFGLADGELTLLPTPRGCIDDVSVGPGGAAEYVWSSAEHPWQLRATSIAGPDRQLFGALPGGHDSVPLETVWVDGPGGPVHVLISRPPAGRRSPGPGVFRLHGGPHEADEDRFNAMRAAWVDAGMTVVQVNYRGSSGYGAAWRNAIVGRPGVTELQDVMAVRQWCVAAGLVDDRACLVEGYSWGGMLALLAVGRHPDQWAAAIAGLPVADWISTFEDEMPPLQAEDSALFGGSPSEVPEAYRAASPLTYVDQVRAPVLVLAGENDPRCPIRQIEHYAGALGSRTDAFHLLRYDMGHGPQVVELVEAFIVAGIAFARNALAGSYGRGELGRPGGG